MSDLFDKDHLQRIEAMALKSIMDDIDLENRVMYELGKGYVGDGQSFIQLKQHPPKHMHADENGQASDIDE